MSSTIARASPSTGFWVWYDITASVLSMPPRAAHRACTRSSASRPTVAWRYEMSCAADAISAAMAIVQITMKTTLPRR